MLKTIGLICFIITAATTASAQMMVHAVSGKIKAVTPTNISVVMNGDATTQFNITKSSPSLDFPADLRSDSTPPSNFQKAGDFAILYYYGYGDQRTVVGVKDLGSDSYVKVQGTVTAFDKHTRTVTVRDDGGKELAMLLSENLIVDTDHGLENGRRFQPHKGDTIRATVKQGAQLTAVFLGEQL